MAGDTYNGWRNYETWDVNLWLANDEAMYRDVLGIVADEYDPDDENTPADEAADRIAARIQEYVESLPDSPIGSASMFADLVGAALREVDWVEIACAFADIELPPMA